MTGRWLWLMWVAACARPVAAPAPAYPTAAYAAFMGGWVQPQALLFVLLPAPAFATHGPSHQPAGAPLERGKASYYHDSLAGNATASGEPYDPAALTAAHRTLPFGSVVDVVRADGRWVRVRINDRGPFRRGRVIDLSRRAAEHVDLIQAGVADVALYLVWTPSGLQSQAVTAP